MAFVYRCHVPGTFPRRCFSLDLAQARKNLKKCNVIFLGYRDNDLTVISITERVKVFPYEKRVISPILQTIVDSPFPLNKVSVGETFTV